MKKHLVVILSCLALLSACANTYNRVETGGTERTGTRLDDSRAVLVMTPKDGAYGGKIYKGSGVTAARVIDASFSREARLVDVSPSEYHSLDELKDSIAKNDYGYIVVPTLALWAHPDKTAQVANQVRVKITILDATTGEEVSSNFLEGKGPSPTGLYSFFGFGNLGPDELLSKQTDDYVDDLYGVLFSF